MGFKDSYYSSSSKFRASEDKSSYVDKRTDVGSKQLIYISSTYASYPKILRRHVRIQEVFEENTWVSNHN